LLAVEDVVDERVVRFLGEVLARAHLCAVDQRVGNNVVTLHMVASRRVPMCCNDSIHAIGLPTPLGTAAICEAEESQETLL
jgi:hypothetical protein